MSMKNLFKSLAAFQQEAPVIHKGTQGYGYSYADLPAIFEKINPLLKKHGLGFYQSVEKDSIKTVIFHVESEEKIESNTFVPFDSLVYEDVEKTSKDGKKYIASIIKGFDGMNKAQAIGSLITYFRRYSLSSVLGLVTDIDNDGTGSKAQVKKSDKPDVKEWLTEEQFKKTMNGTKQQIINTLTAYNGLNGKSMKKEYKKQLEELLSMTNQ